jgi:hypothetical protein
VLSGKANRVPPSNGTAFDAATSGNVGGGTGTLVLVLGVVMGRTIDVVGGVTGIGVTLGAVLVTGATMSRVTGKVALVVVVVVVVALGLP